VDRQPGEKPGGRFEAEGSIKPSGADFHHISD